MRAIFLLLYFLTTTAFAAKVNVKIIDQSNKPVKDAVVTLKAKGKAKPPIEPMTAVMRQNDYKFKPHVLPITVGSKVSLPNQDATLHHVYSFSPAKRFEFKLYSKKKVPSVTFDKTGVVTLGCNIHDSMLAYIYVLDTPYFVKTKSNGLGTIKDMPAGKYKLTVWHPRLKRGNKTKFTVQVQEDGALEREFKLELKPTKKAKKKSSSYKPYRDEK